jgi:hypothetical protein
VTQQDIQHRAKGTLEVRFGGGSEISIRLDDTWVADPDLIAVSPTPKIVQPNNGIAKRFVTDNCCGGLVGIPFALAKVVERLEEVFSTECRREYDRTKAQTPLLVMVLLVPKQPFELVLWTLFNDRIANENIFPSPVEE